MWGTKLSINADKTDLQYSFILKTPSTNKNKALLKMSCLTEGEMRTWLTKIREAMKLNMEMASEMARNKKTSGGRSRVLKTMLPLTTSHFSHS